MFCFRYTFCVCKHKKTILSYRMDQKLSSKLLFIYSLNSDGFYIFHISQGSVATQLRCGGMFSNHFITKMHQGKNIENRSIFHKDIDKTLWLTFLGHPVHFYLLLNCTHAHAMTAVLKDARNTRWHYYLQSSY